VAIELYWRGLIAVPAAPIIRNCLISFENFSVIEIRNFTIAV